MTSLPTLVERIERQRSLSNREGEATVPGGGDGVKILTVHDAKGMEFPVVVVPGISRRFNMKAAVGDGKVEFEQIDTDDGRPYAVGLKAPDPDDPFDMTTTVARESLKERRKAEERAEEKRVLYVACTRARDRLLLSGLHDLDGDTLTEIKSADPEEASSWRDWIQPHVLTEETLAALETTERVTTTFGDASFTVSLPTPPADWSEESDVPTPDVELSQTPSRPARRFRLSPTNLASLFDGWGTLRVDERTNTVYYEGEDDEDSAEGDGDDSPTDVPATVFGELVHRLCELRPPDDHVDDVIDQVLDAEDHDEPLTAADRERVLDHAERSMAYVDALHDEYDVEYTYDELRVTAEFDRGEVSGLIDHLVVTPDAYHVVDYKTNDIEVSEVAEKAEYYRTQMAAYAIALHQQDPERTVTTTLYFTTPDEAHRFEWTPAELDALKREFGVELTQAIDAVDT